MNVNAQQSNQFLNYQNYHHDQLMHQQYFDENHHVQNYNFIPSYSNETYAATPATAPPTEHVNHQENFTAIQSNELYEFLPEEIFQLDQPIIKSESQSYNTNVIVQTAANMETMHLPFHNHNPDVSSASFLDLSSGQIQTNVKYPMTTAENFSSEINNNSSYQPNVGDNTQAHSKVSDVNSYNSYQLNHEAPPRLTCAVESEKVLKRKHLEIDPVVKQNHQNYHLNQPFFSKRENSCLLQQASTNYYPTDLYANFSSKPNDVYHHRTMEKYNNYITNN
jgi:hypothetical protein